MHQGEGTGSYLRWCKLDFDEVSIFHDTRFGLFPHFSNTECKLIF